MLRSFGWVLVTGISILTIADSATAAIAGLERVATGLSSPIYATHAPGDRDRLFIVQRGGAIRILNLTTGQLEATPFLSIPSVDTAGEGGLLGLAFHPDYANNGKFYVNVTIDNGGLNFQGATSPFSTQIREYSVSANPNVANATPRPILSIVQPQNNHNAGWIDFSPVNGYLYVPTGDGGSGNDDGSGHTAGIGNAQDITDNLLGKVLRIDVNGDDFPADASRNYAIPTDNPFVGTAGDDEIWATGLRNPFRNSFDRLTGDLWLGDVGQGQREEINRQPADAPAGENFGWRLREGNIQTPSVGGPIPPNYRGPIYDYGHGNGSFQGNAVVGGYVYRGPDPSLQGTYFFADNTSSHRWIMDTSTFAVQNVDSLLVPDVGSVNNPAAFAEDAVGNLYIVSIGTGNVFRIVTNELLTGDYNADGFVDENDFAHWQANFGVTSGAGLAADGNGDGIVDAADFTVWRNNLGASVHDLGAGSSSASVPEPAGGFLLTWAAAMIGFFRLKACA